MTQLTNSHKADVVVNVGNFGELTLRPTFEAMVAFEDKIGFSSMKVLEKVAQCDISVSVLVAAIWAGNAGYCSAIGAPQNAHSYESIGKAVMDMGTTSLFAPIAQFIRVSSGLGVFTDKKENEEENP